MRVLERSRVVAALVALVVAGGCSTLGTRSGDPGVNRSGNRVEVTGQQLAGSSSLLDGLASRVSNFNVVRRSSECPRIHFRGARSVGPGAGGRPNVYVDGTQMLNTCVLETIRVDQISRVEIYSGGSVPPPYRGGPHGAILVYLVTG